MTGTPGQRLQVQNPLYPVTERSYGAYAVLLLALVLFAVGIVGSLAVMCIVWHSYYLKSAWNSILASLALWDFLVLFFCPPNRHLPRDHQAEAAWRGVLQSGALRGGERVALRGGERVAG